MNALRCSCLVSVEIFVTVIIKFPFAALLKGMSWVFTIPTERSGVGIIVGDIIIWSVGVRAGLLLVRLIKGVATVELVGLGRIRPILSWTLVAILAWI